mgnify:CR=1 FL=1
MDSDIIDHLHSTRKDGNIIKAGMRKILSMPSKALKLLPVMIHHAIHFKSDLKQFRKDDKYLFGMHRDNFNRAVSILLDSRILLFSAFIEIVVDRSGFALYNVLHEMRNYPAQEMRESP